jgi:flagellar biosynthesis protein FlhG
MVAPEDAQRAAEIAARGTDASPLEDVLDAAPAPHEMGPPRAAFASRFDAEAERDEGFGSAAASASPPESAEETAAEPGLETLYDTLGVSPQASREQIEKAHRFCQDMYKEGALATYSLLEVGDAQAARSRIGLAYETLSDPERRRQYDLSLGYTPTVPQHVPYALNAGPAPAASSDAGPSPAVLLASGPLLGADLRRIRESRGIALREVASSTKIGLRFLEYIEEDRLALLPPPVYLRGFLQEYARVLGLDPRKMAEAYMSRLPARP